MTLSYVVRQTSKLDWTSKCSALIFARVFGSPWKRMTRSEGHQREHSFAQLVSVDLGVMTRCGPATPRDSLR